MVAIMVVSYIVVGIAIGILSDKYWLAAQKKSGCYLYGDDDDRGSYFTLCLLFWPVMWMIPPVRLIAGWLEGGCARIGRLLHRINGD